MSTFTSSAINKTGKTVAPKAVARRRPAERRPQASTTAANVPTPELSQSTDERPAAGPIHETVVASITETADDTEGSAPTAPNEHTAEEAVISSAPEVQTPWLPQEPARLQTPPSTQPLDPTSRPGEDNAEVEAIESVANGTSTQAASQAVVSDTPIEQLSDSTTTAPTERHAGSEILPTPSSETLPNPSQSSQQKTAGKKRKRGVGTSSEPSRTRTRSAKAASSSIEPHESDNEAPGVAVTDGAGSQDAQQQESSVATIVQTTETESMTENSGVAAQPQRITKTAKPRAKRTKKAPLGEATVNESEAGTEAAQAQPTSTEAPTDERPKRARKPRQSRQSRRTSGSQVAVAGTDTEAQVSPEIGEQGDDVDPELQEIDPTKITMTELIREGAIGQVSEREKKMREIDWREVARKRREGPATSAVEAQSGGEQTNDAASTQADTPRRLQPTMQLRMVDGQIMLDEASQHIDRQAQALMDADNMVIDENADLTKRVNCMTWVNDKKRDPAERLIMYKIKSDPWGDEDTDRFYEALRMFGTDFHIISKMFPPRTRRQIKLKFVREERLDPARINTALSGGQIVPMDLGHYATATGLEASEFKDPNAVNEELEAQKRLNDQEIEKRKEEASEAQKQKDIMHEQREREREDRDREKAVQKERRDEARRRKRAGRGIMGSGTF